MFYSLFKKLIKPGPNSLLKIFLLGSVFYLLFHAVLYAREMTNASAIKYRHYIYYVMLFDLIVAGLYHYISNRKKNDTKEKPVDLSESDNKSQSYEETKRHIDIIREAVKKNEIKELPKNEPEEKKSTDATQSTKVESVVDAQSKPKESDNQLDRTLEIQTKPKEDQEKHEELSDIDFPEYHD